MLEVLTNEMGRGKASVQKNIRETTPVRRLTTWGCHSQEANPKSPALNYKPALVEENEGAMRHNGYGELACTLYYIPRGDCYSDSPLIKIPNHWGTGLPMEPTCYAVTCWAWAVPYWLRDEDKNSFSMTASERRKMEEMLSGWITLAKDLPEASPNTSYRWL